MKPYNELDIKCFCSKMWTMPKGNKIPINTMTDTHMRNCLRFYSRRGYKIESILYLDFEQLQIQIDLLQQWRDSINNLGYPNDIY